MHARICSSSVAEYWQTFQLDLVNYQNKCRLIRGWDDLFTKLTEHSSSITSMKLSPYYKVFEEEAVWLHSRACVVACARVCSLLSLSVALFFSLSFPFTRTHAHTRTPRTRTHARSTFIV